MVHEFEINGGPIPKHVEDAVMSFDRHPYLRNINLSQSATLRQLKQQVKVSLDELASFRQNVAGLREGVTDFSKYFGFRISPNSSLGVLHKLVALEAIITNTGPLRMAWFEPTRRDELLALKASCREDIQVCNDITTRRNGVWASAAFEKSGNDIAQRAIEFEPFWRRLLAMINGRWRQFGEEYRELYRSQPPNPQLLFWMTCCCFGITTAAPLALAKVSPGSKKTSSMTPRDSQTGRRYIADWTSLDDCSRSSRFLTNSSSTYVPTQVSIASRYIIPRSSSVRN